MFTQVRLFACVVLLSLVPRLECADRKRDTAQYGGGLIVNVPASEPELTKAVEDVAGNGIIRGTKEYEKDQYVTGATPASESRLFPARTEGGKVFYKVRLHALDPRNFKNGGDVGTLAVRYIVMRQDDTHSVLRIDAVFVEDFRHSIHQSNGSVEGAEYKDIHDHIEAMELVKTQTAEAEKKKQQQTIKQLLPGDDRHSEQSTPAQAQAQLADEPKIERAEVAPAATRPSESATAPPQSLEQRLHDLRRQAERLVKAPGAPLKSAPFHSATNLKSLPAGTEVLIVISTPYWYGVETHQGQNGWMLRDDLEELP